MEVSAANRVRFGVFALDLKAGELREGARKVLLQEQAFQILLMLVERRGQLVTREEIQKKLWPNDTVVEFDHSINSAIKKLRRALGDSAENPKYIETVARRGYRLLMPVEWVGVTPTPGSPSPEDVEAASRRHAAPGGINPPLPSLTGKKVSHYRVLEILGGGGMGVIYRAEDIKLGRRVALKVLPEELVSDPLALERFEREARAASALEHPNICPIYEFGEHEGQPFIVMPLLEGQTLRELIAVAPVEACPVRDRRPDAAHRAALQIDRVLDLAIQIADGLDAAHQKGIIHREIKPANIFITTRGEAKILDFGLAKLAEADAAAGLSRQTDDGGVKLPLRDARAGETPALHLTRTGVKMGTVAYMSPEQVRGEKLDARTDLFSFGLILYEMATGHRAFSGDTAPILHAAILNRTPEPARKLNPELPASLEAVINKALQKDRERRYQTAAELRAGLAWARKEVPARRWRRIKLATAAVVIAAATLAYLFRPALPPSYLSPAVQLTYDGVAKRSQPASATFATNGTHLYFNEWPSGYDSSIGLFEIPVTGGAPSPVPTSLPNPLLADISPDHSALLVLSASRGVLIAPERRLWLLPLHGGAARPVGSIVAHAAAFSRDRKRIIYGTGHDLFLAKPDGTDTLKLLTLKEYAWNIRWSPDGGFLRFDLTDRLGADPPTIWEVRADGSGLRPLLPEWGDSPQCCGLWMLDGNYVVGSAGARTPSGEWTLWAIREKGKPLRKWSREPVQLSSLPGILGAELPSLDGKTLFITSRAERAQLVRYDAKRGRFVPYLSGISIRSADFSRDGQWIAYGTFPERELWRSRLDGSEKLQLAASPFKASWPRWSPDGKQIVFFGRASPEAPTIEVYMVPPDGSSPPRAVAGILGDWVIELAWSPDGSRLAFGGAPPNPNPGASQESVRDVHILNLADGKLSPLPRSRGFSVIRWSPQGRLMAAASPDLGAVMLFDLGTQEWRPLAKLPGEIFDLKWSRRGDYIYCLQKHQRGAPEMLGVFRVRLKDGGIESVVSLKDITLKNQSWLGLGPDDSVLLSEAVDYDDIYSFGWHAP